MLEADCKSFLDFVQRRDPVFVIEKYSSSLNLESLTKASEHANVYCLWNQAVCPVLIPEKIEQKDGTLRYHTGWNLPVIEFDYRGPVATTWNERPALTQGRVWASFQQADKRFESWYNAVIGFAKTLFATLCRSEDSLDQRRTSGTKTAAYFSQLFCRQLRVRGFHG